MYDGGDWGVLDLTQDPVQGDPANVRALATFSQNESGFWSEHTETLTTTADYGSSMPMEGDFAPKYRDHLNELPGRASALRDAHEKAGSALGQYAATLDEAKGESRQALTQGIQAREQYQQAQQAYEQAVAEMNSLPRVVPPEQYPYVLQQWEYLQAQANRAQTYMEQAEQQRLVAKDRAMQAGQAATQAEGSCAQQVRAAAPASVAPKQSTSTSFGPNMPAGMAQGLWKVNPNFDPRNIQFSANCPHTVTAYELSRRGIDVEAAPLPEKYWPAAGRPLGELEEVWGRKVSLGGKADIDKSFTDPGSRGVVGIRFRNGGAHLFSWENVDGKIRYFDTQNGVSDAEHYFGQQRPGTVVSYMRLDDLPMPHAENFTVPPTA
jgi:hypothetical protein